MNARTLPRGATSSSLALLLALFLSLMPETAGAQDPTSNSEPAAGSSVAEPLAPEPAAAAPWTRRIDSLVQGLAISVVVGQDHGFLYRFKPIARRAPASNEKLLLSMAILDELGPDHRIRTSASAEDFDAGIVDGDLWIIGHGDPEITGQRMSLLARELDDSGVTQVRGSVRGSVSVFKHDWWASGWKPYFPSRYVALPTALAFNRNTVNGSHIRDPELRAARSLTRALRERDIRVGGKPKAGRAPSGTTEVAGIDSSTLVSIVRRMDVPSDNWYAETLGKLLGASAIGGPGTIGKGARAIDEFAEANGAPDIRPFDSSGLSYDDRITADNVVRLLWYCETQPWAEDLRWALPRGGEGTLSSRFKAIDVRAKTGTLDGISALSGWVRSEKSDEWVEFSIVSRGMPKSTASHIEDRIVTIVANAAE